MPCYDPVYEPDPSELAARSKEKKAAEDERSMVEAVLCGIFTQVEEANVLTDFISCLDYHAMGVSEDEVLKWWKAHKKKDEIRKRQEEKLIAQKNEKARLKEVKKNALKKLSEEERNALGFKD